MSATQAFSAGLTRLGFDAPTCKLLVDQGTIALLCDLTNLPFPEIDKMIQYLSRWKPKVVEDDDDDPVAGPTFPYLSIRKFKRFAPWQPIIPCAMKSLTQQTFMTVLSRVFF